MDQFHTMCYCNTLFRIYSEYLEPTLFQTSSNFWQCCNQFIDIRNALLEWKGILKAVFKLFSKRTLTFEVVVEFWKQ